MMGVIGMYFVISAMWALWRLYRYPYRLKVAMTYHRYDILSTKGGWLSQKHYYIDGEFSFVWQGKEFKQQGTGFDSSYYRFLSEAETQKRFENWQKRGSIGFVDAYKKKVILDIPIDKADKRIEFLKDINFGVVMICTLLVGLGLNGFS